MEIIKTTHFVVSHLRTTFLQENNIQFILDKAHRYGWADVYSFSVNDTLIGYGSVWGKNNREERDTIFEFYLINGYRDMTEQIFAAFCRASRVTYVESQSNDKFLHPMFEKFTEHVEAEAILFEDHLETRFQIDNTSLSLRPQLNPDDCQYVLMSNGEAVGEGGFMLNYNFPYADLYYSVKEQHRQKGFGSFFIQELKKQIYAIGRLPAARCNATNFISKATLLKGGMITCGQRLSGNLKSELRLI